MPLRHLVVTPLPNGAAGDTRFLSVHLSPRLRENGQLDAYLDFADWGQFVAKTPLSFEVLLNGAVRPGVTVAVVSPPADPEVWRAVFGDPTKLTVSPFRFLDRSGIDLTTIDSATYSDRLMALQRSISALGADTATREMVLAAAGPLLAAQLPAGQEFFGAVGDGGSPAMPSPEFHDQLGPLHAHPFLMRLLGLVFDLEIELPPGAGVITEVAVRTNWASAQGLATHDQVPMRVRVDGDFHAVVREPAYRVGDWLHTGGANYTVAQVDLIQATHQLGQLADDLDAAGAGAPVEVPALLESGLSLICHALGDELAERLDRQRGIEDAIDRWLTGRPGARPPLLAAEDITLGYRMDVEDVKVPGFRSLHDRQAPAGYRFPQTRTAVKAPPDEGWNSIALSTDGSSQRAPQTSNVVYTQEGGPAIEKAEERDVTAWRVDDHIATWGGWSLSAPRVGNTTTGRGDVKEPDENTTDPAGAAQVVVDYAHVKGTLPVLRYGRTYRIRARCVDLAGNGPTLADTAPAGATSAPTTFGRLSPLSAPLPVRRVPRPIPGVGDLPDVLVIRSELDDTDTSTLPTDRLLFPPRIGQGKLERHDLPEGGIDPDSYDFLASADARSIEDQTVIDPETGELVADGTEHPPILYLADPGAEAVALIGLPGTDDESAVTMPHGAWSVVEAVRLQLRSGGGEPVADGAARTVTVHLPKGTVARAELSTAPAPGRLEQFATGQGLDAEGRDVALNGRNRSLSPRRVISFVHAVRLPLAPPAFGEMDARRNRVGQTDVAIAGELEVHRATTEHVVLRGRWVDPVDDPAESAGPGERVTKKIITDLAIPEADDEDTTEAVPLTRLELGDTRRHHVAVLAEAFCRFSRYFTERLAFISGNGSTVQLHADGVVPHSVTLARSDGSERFRRGQGFEVERDGMLTILDVTAIPPGTPLRAEFIPLPVSRSSLEEPDPAAAEFVFDVASSSPPALPGVLAALPAASRTVTATDDRIVVDHDGRVVRLHLDRPWYSTGIGELLGVAVGGAGAPLTRWSRDPISRGTGPIEDLTTAAFTGAVETAAEVDGRFDVAGHAVTYDSDRGFWTADIPIDATFGYRPFVQLHVCRYQPLSVDGQHLSGTIELDPIRLGVARRVVVTNLDGDSVRVRLTGSDERNTVTAIVQTADGTIADPDLQWQDISSNVLTRSGSRAASVHSGAVAVPAAGATRRLVVEDAEGEVVVYREVIAIPDSW